MRNAHFLLPLALLAAIVARDSSAEPDCEAVSQQIASAQQIPLDERIVELRKHNERCTGSGFYEYYFGILYATAGDRETALESLARAREAALPLPYRRSVEVTIADIFAARGASGQAEEQYRRAVAAYPAWYFGEYSLGLFLLGEDRAEEALEHLERAHQLNPNHYGTTKQLAAAYLFTGQPRLSVRYLDLSYKLNPDILGERVPMLAGARAYLQLGDAENAEALLGVLAKRRPEVKTDQGFREAVALLRQLQAEQNGHAHQ